MDPRRAGAGGVVEEKDDSRRREVFCWRKLLVTAPNAREMVRGWWGRVRSGPSEASLTASSAMAGSLKSAYWVVNVCEAVRFMVWSKGGTAACGSSSMAEEVLGR